MVSKVITGADLKLICRMQRQRFQRILNKKRSFYENDKWIRQVFADDGRDTSEKTQALIKYFWDAQRHYIQPGETLAYYPGLPSIYGARNDAIEGVTRLMPLWAAYIRGGFGSKQLIDQMKQHLVSAFSNGTNPHSKFYWGRISDRSTLICEGADVALALWLSKQEVWPALSAEVRRNVIEWLKQIPGKKTADNNWHLFVVLVDLVIADLDESHVFQSQERYQRIKSFYLGDGCFRDGENGHIDLYNAWGFHYLLFWINSIEPKFDPNFISNSAVEFCRWYKYLIKEDGVVLFGRSLCYRMAMPAPLFAGTYYDSKSLSAERALAAYHACWKLFVESGALQYGRPTQGVFEENENWLDPYSGPASAFWSTRSIVIMLFDERYRDLHLGSMNEALPVPVEPIYCAKAGLSIVPENSGNVRLQIEQKNSNGSNTVAKKGLISRARSFLYAAPHRVNTNLMLQGETVFSSDMLCYREPAD